MAELSVEAESLSVRFGDFYAVRNVSFRVERGEIFGFLGANGAGKTTTIRVLCGLLAPTEGRVRVAGTDFGKDGIELKTRVGYMSQRFTLYDDLTVGENLTFTTRLRKLKPEVAKRRREELLQFISFDAGEATLVRDLPGGIKQQVSLVASLLHDPEVVFLDEPTAGVTPAYRALFWDLIRKLAKQGKTVFVTTHYMDEAEQCGRIALMRAGELIALDTPQALKTQVFPEGLLELELVASMTGDLNTRLISDLRQSGAFRLFEPYGMRFHAEVGNPEIWARLQPELKSQFRIRPIQPTLEDVFIRLVEGTTR